MTRPVGAARRQQPRLWRKVALTTLVACVVWGLAFALIESEWISFREGCFAAPKW